jgi:hypothetical protein
MAWLVLTVLAGCKGCDETPHRLPTPADSPSATSSADSVAKTNVQSAERFCHDTYGGLIAHEAQACSDDDRASEEFTLRQQIGMLGEALCAEWLLKALANQRLRLDTTKLDACSKAVLESGSRKRIEKQFVACEGFAIGLQKVEQSCAHDLECEAGLHCLGAVERDGKKPGRDGVCKPPSARGEHCGKDEVHDPVHAAHPTCQPGLFCDERGETSCRALVSIGAVCDTGDRCERDGECLSKRCVVASLPASDRSAGQPCDDSAQCAGRCVRKSGQNRGSCATFCGSK